MTFGEMTKLCEGIIAGFDIEPKMKFWGMTPTDEDAVDISFYYGPIPQANQPESYPTILELVGFPVGKGLSHEFSYRWNLDNVFLSASDHQFVYSLKKNVDENFMKWAENLCAEFAKNGISNRLTDWALSALRGAEEAFSVANAQETLHRVLNRDDVLCTCYTLSQAFDSFVLEDVFRNKIPKGFPWPVSITADINDQDYRGSSFSRPGEFPVAFQVLIVVTVSDDKKWRIQLESIIDLFIDIDADNGQYYVKESK